MARPSSWTPERDRLLRDRWGKWTNRRIAAELDISLATLRTRAFILGLTNRPWSEDQDAWLRQNIQEKGLEKCAELLKRTTGAVNTRLWRLGIHPEERSARLSAEFVAEIMAVHVTTVYKWHASGKLRGWSVAEVRRFVLAYPELPNMAAMGSSRGDFLFLIAGEME